MNARRMIARALELIRTRRGANPVAGNREELTNIRFGTATSTNLEKQKNVVNSLLLMYSKENETLFI
ncbi:hypothetical protein [Flavobacterium sp.]|uniref:hypothetical protein n=1 Tax=Flavobacterium sp. TaxID=239 RepID=UPI003C573209